MNKKQKILNWIWRGVSAILAVLGVFNWQFVKGILGDIWIKIVAFFTFTFQIEVWMIFLVVVLIMLIRFLLIPTVRYHSIPKFVFKYKTDTMRGFRWSWIWSCNENNKWEIRELKPHCPVCDTPLQVKYGFIGQNSIQLKCPRNDYPAKNNFVLVPEDIKEDVESIIHDNIDKGKY